MGLRGQSASALYDPAKVQTWLADVLWESTAGNVFRCKGLFNGLNPENRQSEINGRCTYALQAVGKIFEVDEAPRDVVVSESKLLVIGRKLHRNVLEEGW